MCRDKYDIYKWANFQNPEDPYWIDCPYCTTPFYYLEGELDHIEPYSRGGSGRKANLVLVCKDCNRTKRDLHLEDFLLENCLDSLETVQGRIKACNKFYAKEQLDKGDGSESPYRAF